MQPKQTLHIMMTDRNRVRAEAKVGRAFEYYLLVNTFGKHYGTSSSTDLGVPLVLHADVSEKNTF